MSEKHYVEEHEQSIHVIVEEELPGHEGRTESSLFSKNKRLLVHEHDLACFNPSCRSKENREVHHWAEWCGEAWYDFEKLKTFLMGHDVYGFSKMYHDRPIESVDDIRNLVVLCSSCHREGPFSMHYAPFPQHVQQAVVKDGHSFEALKDHLTHHHEKD